MIKKIVGQEFIDAGERQAERLHTQKYVPVTIKGKKDVGVMFEGMAVGISVNGLGVRLSDSRFLSVNIQNLFRQAFDLSFKLEDDISIEGCARVVRVEYSKKDPSQEYFMAMKFIYLPTEYESKLKKYITFYKENGEV